MLSAFSSVELSVGGSEHRLLSQHYQLSYARICVPLPAKSNPNPNQKAAKSNPNPIQEVLEVLTSGTPNTDDTDNYIAP